MMGEKSEMPDFKAEDQALPDQGIDSRVASAPEFEIADELLNNGDGHFAVRDLPQASKLYSEARRILESVTENQPMVLPAKHRVLGVLARQRAILKLTSGTQEIVENLRESVVLTELIVEVWPRDEAWLYYLARLYSRLWGSAFIARNYVLAKDACERGSTIIQALRNASPTNERYIAAERTYEKGLA